MKQSALSCNNLVGWRKHRKFSGKACFYRHRMAMPLKCQIVGFCQFVLLYLSPVKNPPVYICAATRHFVRVDNLFNYANFALAAAKPNPSQQSCWQLRHFFPLLEKRLISR